jgi:hypothetical protein
MKLPRKPTEPLLLNEGGKGWLPARVKQRSLDVGERRIRVMAEEDRLSRTLEGCETCTFDTALEQDSAEITVLSPDDVEPFRETFSLQRRGHSRESRNNCIAHRTSKLYRYIALNVDHLRCHHLRALAPRALLSSDEHVPLSDSDVPTDFPTRGRNNDRSISGCHTIEVNWAQPFEESLSRFSDTHITTSSLSHRVATVNAG